MRLKPPPRKLLQILLARNQPLTGKHIPSKVLCHLQRNFVLEIARIDRPGPRPCVPRNDEVMMNPWNMVAAHRLPHHRRNPRAKRTLQILKLDDRHLRTTRRLECRSILERSSIRLRHRILRNRRSNRDKSQSQSETIHSAIHSSGHRNPPAISISTKSRSPHTRDFDRSVQREVEKSASLSTPPPSPDEPSLCPCFSCCHARRACPERSRMGDLLLLLGNPRLQPWVSPASEQNRAFSPWDMPSYPCQCQLIQQQQALSREERIITLTAIQLPIHNPVLDTHDKINSGTNSPAQAGLHHLTHH
jgi:hypothetical protein